MASPVIYEVTIDAACEGQQINNILYYAHLAPTNNGWDPDRAADLGAAVNVAWQAEALWLLPSQYEFFGCSIRGLDLDRVPVSTYPVGVGMLDNGNLTSDIETPGLCAIAAFDLVTATEYESERVPRRSYIALGPLTQGQVTDEGRLTLDGTNQSDMEALLEQGHFVDGVQMSPVRLGFDNAAGQPGIGAVANARFRPFASFRRSRLRRPSGR